MMTRQNKKRQELEKLGYKYLYDRYLLGERVLYLESPSKELHSLHKSGKLYKK